jgi:hypothetical protein
MNRRRQTDPKAARIWRDFQASTPPRPIRCNRCFAEIAGLKLFDWKLGNRDCIRGVCASCGFRSEGRLYCDEHARIHSEAMAGAHLELGYVN